MLAKEKACLQNSKDAQLISVRPNQITRELQIITINQYLNACVEKTIKNEATPTVKNQSKPHQTKSHQKNNKESTKFKQNPPNSSHESPTHSEKKKKKNERQM
jgi:hypothetical protein